MSDDLKAELTEIDGIGDARAEEIIEVVDQHETPVAGAGADELFDLLDNALGYYEQGDDEYGYNFVREAHELLQGR